MQVTATQHPGKILFVDADGEEPDVELDAAEVPESIRFASTKDGLVPVVKVVKSTAGDARHIRAYGEDGQLLQSTLQTRQAPAKARRPFTAK